MEEIIINFAKDIVSENILLSFIFFFISQSLQILFPPYPGDMVLILEGYLSELANLNIIIIIINAILATFISSVLLYKLGKKEDEKILQSKLIKYLFDVNKVDKLRKLFEKIGPLVIIISKFIPGIFSITMISAGIFKMKKRLVYISTLLVTSLHHIVLILLGKFLGENWTVIFNKINMYNKYIFILGIIGLAVYGGLHLLKKKLLT
ncbi:DedA family protein [Dethiothermospora halolimnae]|uniref:DedA family protein n=1 Tax=Dethiothermospora halolimnae TaxID=3114390 RepID=UPI003CCBCA94